MQMVQQMLFAAMSEDPDGNDEDKEEAARQADEGIAMLKAKLEKARADETANGITPADAESEAKPEGNDHKDNDDKKRGDGDSPELRARLEEAEATVSHLIP